MKTKPFTPAQQVVVQPGTALAVVSPRTPPCSAICPLPSAVVPTARLRTGRHPCLGSSVGQVDGPARTPGLSTALLVFLPRLGDPSTGTCVRELGLGQHGLGVPSRAAGRAGGPSCLPVLRCLVPGKLPALPPGPRPPARPTLAAVVDSAETAWLPTSSRVQSGRTLKTNMAAFVHTGLLCGGSHVHGDGVGRGVLFSLLTSHQVQVFATPSRLLSPSGCMWIWDYKAYVDACVAELLPPCWALCLACLLDWWAWFVLSLNEAPSCLLRLPAPHSGPGASACGSAAVSTILALRIPLGPRQCSDGRPSGVDCVSCMLTLVTVCLLSV